MKSHKLETILAELNSYSEMSLADNVNERLGKTLLLYLDELSKSYDRMLGKKTSLVIRRLSNYENRDK